MSRKKADLPIYTLDTETDPFRFGRLPKPFALGFFDGQNFHYTWGKDCVEQMRVHISAFPPGIIYAHNGGRFDIFFLMEWILGRAMRIINSRIIKATMRCEKGFHEIRDSYSIMPFALSKAKGKVQKKSIEMWKLEAEHREEHKQEIIDYLKPDCVALWELCTDFIEEFGPMLTIGSTAMKEIKKFHPFDNLEESEDQDIRSRYYYGGRVQAFEKGMLCGNWQVFDVNSSYPHSMKEFLHPIGRPSSEGISVRDNTCFISASGFSHGAFPVRLKGGGISFPVGDGMFHVTRHEWDVALELGLFETKKIHRCINFEKRGNMAEFVDTQYQMRIDFNLAGQLNKGLQRKFVLNSGYGKYSQNPDNYKEYCITDVETDLHSQGYEPEEIKYGTYIVWSRRTRDSSRYNVSTGASITGASRGLLLRGIAGATRPIYCDTDSIICESLSGLEQHPSKLGAWKQEAVATLAAIAGKKLYVLYDGEKVVKQANKGVRVTAEQIVRVCQGETILSQREAPSFKLDGSHNFIERRVRMT